MPLDETNYQQQDAVLDLLRRARARVARPGGWCQNVYQRGDAVCALGAIYPRKEQSTKAHTDAASCLMGFVPGGYCSVPEYNDHPRRTQAEVVALFDAAIATRGSR